MAALQYYLWYCICFFQKNLLSSSDIGLKVYVSKDLDKPLTVKRHTFFHIKNVCLRDGVMGQQLRAIGIFQRTLTHSYHRDGHRSQLFITLDLRHQCPLLTSAATGHACDAHTCSQKNTHIK